MGMGVPCVSHAVSAKSRSAMGQHIQHSIRSMYPPLSAPGLQEPLQRTAGAGNAGDPPWSIVAQPFISSNRLRARLPLARGPYQAQTPLAEGGNVPADAPNRLDDERPDDWIRSRMGMRHIRMDRIRSPLGGLGHFLS